ncbi:uncharacterized protein LOC143838778 [Paroedura picta]|uniref:uncharacterized protein LOC143838778 n=1 Tax=Paroedura picta TaxID=143630 RepID=UPI004056F703
MAAAGERGAASHPHRSSRATPAPATASADAILPRNRTQPGRRAHVRDHRPPAGGQWEAAQPTRSLPIGPCGERPADVWRRPRRGGASSPGGRLHGSLRRGGVLARRPEIGRGYLWADCTAQPG